MGSLNDGLIRWRHGVIARVTRSVGLPVRGIHAILEDDQGVFWMSSNRGIVRSDRQALHALADGTTTRFAGQILDRNDGLLSAECPSGQQPTVARDALGRFCFATLKGVTRTTPGNFRANDVPPHTMVEEVIYHLPDRRDAPGSPTERHLSAPFPASLELPPGGQRVEIRYTAPSFCSPEKVRFQVRLLGLDEAWRDITERRVAYLGNLKPGRYVFEARAANDDGLWDPIGTRLAFTLLPHFWQTAWFQVLVVLAVLTWAVVWAQQVKSRLHERATAQAEFTRKLITSQENERRRVARELHDDVTQRLARLAMDAALLERSASSPADKEILVELRQGLTGLSKDVHALSYQMHPSILEDLGLAEALKVEAERFSQQHAIEVQVNVLEVPASVPREPALCVFRVTQEALRNVSRHAKARNVHLSLRGLDGGLQLAIQDDGTGFDPALAGRRRSLGLAGMRERVQLLGGNLDVESTPGQGTAIVAWLPLKASST
jgi:signal transduction histidine kinase